MSSDYAGQLESHKATLKEWIQNLNILLTTVPIPNEAYVKMLIEIKDLFVSSAFLISPFADLRKSFFSELSSLVFRSVKNSCANDTQTISDLKLRFKFPLTIVVLVYSQMLEMEEALASDFLLMLNIYFDFQNTKIYSPSLMCLNILLSELYQEDAENEEAPNSQSTLSTISELTEISIVTKRIYITHSTVQEFFVKEGISLVAFTIQVLQHYIQAVQSKEIVSKVDLCLKLIYKITKNFTKSQSIKFTSTFSNECQLIIQTFLSLLKQSESSKEEFVDLSFNMFQFCECLMKSLTPAQHYVMIKDCLLYLQSHFSASNDQVELYDFHIWSFNFIITLFPFYSSKNENISAYPLILALAQQSTKMNLINFEDQIYTLTIWSYFAVFILDAHDDQANTMDTNIINNLSVLNSSFLEAIEYNIKFLLEKEIKINEMEDINRYVDELSHLIILSNLIDSKIFTEVLSSIQLVYQKNTLLYYSLQKSLMKKYLYFSTKLSQIYITFGKHDHFLNISSLIFNSFGTAQSIYCNLDLQTIVSIEEHTSFVESIGSMLYNQHQPNFEKTGTLELFVTTILNPMEMLNRAIFCKLPESLISLTEVQFTQLCIMMSSVNQFYCGANRNTVDYVFQIELDLQFIQKIISFKQALNPDESFWISPQYKEQRKKVKLFYQSTIYWIMFASMKLESPIQLFDSYFLSSFKNVKILDTVLFTLRNKILPNSLLAYLCLYFKDLTEREGFTNCKQTFQLCLNKQQYKYFYYLKVIQSQLTQKKIRKLMVTLSNQLPKDLTSDYSKLEYYISLYLNQKCQWLRYTAFNDATILSLTESNKFPFVYEVFDILEDLFSILQKYPKMYSEQSAIGLKRNYFFNRIIWVILKSMTILTKQEILDNTFMIGVIQQCMNQVLRFKADFLENEEHPSENMHYFNFILEILGLTYNENRKPSIEFCQHILTYFHEEKSNQNVLNLAQSSPQFQKVTLQFYINTWEIILTYCSTPNEKNVELKEKDFANMVNFILKFAKCLKGNLNMLHDNLILTIKNNQAFGTNSEIIYKTILEHFVIKEIEGISVLQNIFLRSIVKDLKIWYQSMNPTQEKS